MKILPGTSFLAKHIDHYWIVNNDLQCLGDQQLYAYPGVSPELFIPLNGYLKYTDNGFQKTVHEPTLFSFIDKPIFLDFRNTNCFVVVRFKPRGVSSLLPFTKVSTDQLFKGKITPATYVFKHIQTLTYHVKEAFPENLPSILDDFFSSILINTSSGFVAEMLTGKSMNLSPAQMILLTGYSRSTLERRFKRETGLTPKAFQRLKRFRLVIDELCESKNLDWHYYVNKFNYFDQSHFIKEIKTFSRVTPSFISTEKTLFTYRF